MHHTRSSRTKPAVTVAALALLVSFVSSCSDSGSNAGSAQQPPGGVIPGASTGACSLLSDSEAQQVLGGGGFSHYAVTDSGAVVLSGASQCGWSTPDSSRMISVAVVESLEKFTSNCDSGDDGYGNEPVPVAGVGDSSCYIPDKEALWSRVGGTTIYNWIYVLPADAKGPTTAANGTVFPDEDLVSVAKIVANHFAE